MLVPPMTVSFAIQTLGEAKVPSPLRLRTASSTGEPSLQPVNYVQDAEHVLYDIDTVGAGQTVSTTDLGELEKAGPREKLFFAPGRVHTPPS